MTDIGYDPSLRPLADVGVTGITLVGPEKVAAPQPERVVCVGCAALVAAGFKLCPACTAMIAAGRA
jgi:hypothetical protein